MIISFNKILFLVYVGAIGLGNGLFSSGSDVPSPGASNFLCDGNESQLADCLFIEVLGERCETASVVCQGKIARCMYSNIYRIYFTIDENTLSDSCVDGKVRLRDGNNPLEGRLEICINNAWGTVCQDEFTSDEARIVCSELGYDNGIN